MDRLRAGLSELALWIGAAIGATVGATLGVITERGAVGLIAIAGAIVGTIGGIYVAQLIVAPPGDDEP